MSTENKIQPYYLYTNGVLKLVDRERPQVKGVVFEGSITHEVLTAYDNWFNSLPSIAVSDDLKAKWKEGQRYEDGKDFVIKNIDPIGMENDKAGKPTAIPVNTLQEEKEDQDELWDEIESAMTLEVFKPVINVCDFIQHLKSKYHITRKK